MYAHESFKSMKVVSLRVRDDDSALEFGRRKQLIVRDRGRRRLKQGAFIRLYRRARRRPLLRAQCDEVMDIHVNGSNKTVILNNRLLDRSECHQLALGDGFNDFSEFILFYKTNGGLPLDGQLLRWW